MKKKKSLNKVSCRLSNQISLPKIKYTHSRRNYNQSFQCFLKTKTQQQENDILILKQPTLITQTREQQKYEFNKKQQNIFTKYYFLNYPKADFSKSIFQLKSLNFKNSMKKITSPQVIMEVVKLLEKKNLQRPKFNKQIKDKNPFQNKSYKLAYERYDMRELSQWLDQQFENINTELSIQQYVDFKQEILNSALAQIIYQVGLWSSDYSYVLKKIWDNFIEMICKFLTYLSNELFKTKYENYKNVNMIYQKYDTNLQKMSQKIQDINNEKKQLLKVMKQLILRQRITKKINKHAEKKIKFLQFKVNSFKQQYYDLFAENIKIRSLLLNRSRQNVFNQKKLLLMIQSVQQINQQKKEKSTQFSKQKKRIRKQMHDLYFKHDYIYQKIIQQYLNNQRFEIYDQQTNQISSINYKNYLLQQEVEQQINFNYLKQEQMKDKQKQKQFLQAQVNTTIIQYNDNSMNTDLLQIFQKQTLTYTQTQSKQMNTQQIQEAQQNNQIEQDMNKSKKKKLKKKNQKTKNKINQKKFNLQDEKQFQKEMESQFVQTQLQNVQVNKTNYKYLRSQSKVFNVQQSQEQQKKQIYMLTQAQQNTKNNQRNYKNLQQQKLNSKKKIEKDNNQIEDSNKNSKKQYQQINSNKKSVANTIYQQAKILQQQQQEEETIYNKIKKRRSYYILRKREFRNSNYFNIQTRKDFEIFLDNHIKKKRKKQHFISYYKFIKNISFNQKDQKIFKNYNGLNYINNLIEGTLQNLNNQGHKYSQFSKNISMTEKYVVYMTNLLVKSSFIKKQFIPPNAPLSFIIYQKYLQMHGLKGVAQNKFRIFVQKLKIQEQNNIKLMAFSRLMGLKQEKDNFPSQDSLVFYIKVLKKLDQHINFKFEKGIF